MRVILFLIVMLSCGFVFAEEKRVAIVSAGIDKARFIWAIENIIQTNDNDVYHKAKYENGEVIIDVSESMDVKTLITEQTIADEIAKEEARVQAVIIAETTKKAQDKDELFAKLKITDEDLKTLKTLLEDIQ